MEKPMNIFEQINKNVVDLSEDIMTMYEELSKKMDKIDAVYDALYPCEEPKDEPVTSGAPMIIQ